MPADERIRLLNPGPVTLTERVRRALLCQDLCHREPQFAEMMSTVRKGLAEVYPDTAGDYTSVLFTGSGTAAVEAMVGSLVPAEGGKALVICNGIYGERMLSMLQMHRKPHVAMQHAWTEGIRLQELESTLGADRSITHVVAVHHETTTGRLNPVHEFIAICRQRNVRLLLDAVSSFGGEPLDLSNDSPIDAIASTANKCLHGVPGISFVLTRESAMRRAPSASPCLYLDLHKNFQAQENGAPLFTPAVQVLAALRESLSELHESGGWRARHQTYKKRSQMLRDGLTNFGLKTLLTDTAAYGSTLTSFALPSGVEFETLYDQLRSHRFVIYPGQKTLFKTVFRVAVMGDLSDDDLSEFINVIGTIVPR